QVLATVGMDRLIKHMPIECSVGVIDLLSRARAVESRIRISIPRYQHAVRRQDLYLVPTSSRVFRSHTYRQTHLVRADREKNRLRIAHEPHVVAIIGNIFLIRNLNGCVRPSEIAKRSGRNGAIMASGTA